MSAMDSENELRELQREYLDFLDDDGTNDDVYKEKVLEMIREHKTRLIVNINDLRQRNSKRANKLLTKSQDEVVAFQRALREYIMTVDATYGKQFDDFNVGFEGSFGSKHVTPRSLSARYLGNMVCLEGIVTKCSLICPKVIKSVHYCPATKKTIERKYTDLTSLEPFPSSAVYPTKDEEGNPLETEYGLSSYRDHQSISVQEMPEKAPAGQLPRSIDIILDGDLVDSCKPGDRIQVIGTYRCLPSKKQNFTAGTFKTIIIANHVLVMSKEVAPVFSAKDVSKIKKFCRNSRHDVFEVLAHSLAPSIHGHDYIKKAILCLLLGGVEKVLDNGTRLRGDINLLLIGDPSTAKSQLLRYVLHTAPRAVTTTGRGSSGVGLTAAVTTDQETNERRLEAGAMVLADRGVVCIDEFDKMSDIDRTAIHEVMEQGRVTIAKAGIHAKLNARCSVLAAANPVYGRYDEYKPPMDNIGMQDSLLSRFDIIFVVLDEMDPDHDRKVSEHVLRMHRYRNPTEQDGEALPMGGFADMLGTGNMNFDEDEQVDTPIYEKHDKLLHGKDKGKVVSMEFMRKYIHVAKVLKPVLTRDACDLIATEYTKLRAQENTGDKAKTQPITARSLETLIRLSTAHAKARMSKRVERVDAEAAIDLVNFAFFKKVVAKPKKKVDKDGEGKSRKRKRPDSSTDKPAKRKPGDAGYDPYDFDTDDDDDSDDSDDGEDGDSGDDGEGGNEGEESMETEQPKDGSSTEDTSTSKPQLTDERMDRFRSLVHNAFSEEHSQSLPVSHILHYINRDDQQQYTKEEVLAALDVMQEANQLMVSEEMVFLI